VPSSYIKIRSINTKEAGWRAQIFNFFILAHGEDFPGRPSVCAHTHERERYTPQLRMNILRLGRAPQDNGQMMRELMGNMCTRCALGTQHRQTAYYRRVSVPHCVSRNLQQPHTKVRIKCARDAPRPRRHLTFSRDARTERETMMVT
jgi:hypothetical protein